MPTFPTTLATSGAFATPHEGRRFAVPAFGRGFQGISDLLRRFGRLTIQSAAHDNALDGSAMFSQEPTRNSEPRDRQIVGDPHGHALSVLAVHGTAGQS